MVLSFSTTLNGKPTNFIEKIWSGFLKIDEELYEDYLHPDSFPSQMPWPPSKYKDFDPKIHTIRKDEKNRWKAGNKIDFFINARTKNMFRFFPGASVISTQSIEILYDYMPGIYVRVDGKLLFPAEIKKLAINDGFANVGEFFTYFSENFTGKIIHWTDLKY